jgi:hypothetical protein
VLDLKGFQLVDILQRLDLDREDLINVPAEVNIANAAHCEGAAKRSIVECTDGADEFRPGIGRQIDVDLPGHDVLMSSTKSILGERPSMTLIS